MADNIFVLVEAVNIYRNVLDTDQLSVVRGGSLLLRKAVRAVKKEFSERLEAISTGASSGLFQVTGGGGDASICDDIIRYLADPKHEYYCDFSFCVETCQAEDLNRAREALYAKLRFRQLRGLAQAPDWLREGERSPGPCGLEGLRRLSAEPEKVPVGGGQPGERLRPLADATLRRFKRGREARWQLYAEEMKGYEAKPKHLSRLSDLDRYGFSGDLESLARSKCFRRLSGKVAVVYFDGNGFGKLQRKQIGEAETPDSAIGWLSKFDEYVGGKRAKFLADLVDQYLPENPQRWPDSTYEDENRARFRLETLLWGGDEMQFVVPAWLGWDLLQLFYDASKGWKAPLLGDGKGDPLTHAGGIVFCPAKTPVRIVRRLAQELAEMVKEAPDGRSHNGFDYLVLESIDYPAETDLADYFRLRYGETMARWRLHQRPATNWTQTRTGLQESMKQDGALPRRQLRRIATALTRDGEALFCSAAERGVGWNALVGEDLPSVRLSPLETLERRMLDLAGPEERSKTTEALKAVIDLFGVDADDQRRRVWAWLHLVELWDYLAPREEKE